MSERQHKSSQQISSEEVKVKLHLEDKERAAKILLTLSADKPISYGLKMPPLVRVIK